MKKYLILLKLFLLFSAVAMQHMALAQDEMPSTFVINFDFKKQSVQEFMLAIKADDEKPINRVQFSIKQKAPVGWVTEDDLSFLISFLYSDATAYCMFGPNLRYTPGTKSTVGGYAAALIMSYRNKTTFPSNQSSCFRSDAAQQTELINWHNKIRPDEDAK